MRDHLEVQLEGCKLGAGEGYSGSISCSINGPRPGRKRPHPENKLLSTIGAKKRNSPLRAPHGYGASCQTSALSSPFRIPAVEIYDDGS